MGTTILTIEDDPAIRSGIVACLEDSGFRMREADNGLAGIELFRRERPDVVLCDLRLPGMDGLEVVSTIVAESPEYVRSSTIQLDGSAAPHLAVFDFRNLPPGIYDVTGVLIGTSGKRAAVRRVVQIVPTADWRHR